MEQPKIKLLRFDASITKRGEVKLSRTGEEVTDHKELEEEDALEELTPENITKLASSVSNYNQKQLQIAKSLHNTPGEEFKVLQKAIIYDETPM